jgi:hypothetical protein
MSRLLRHNIVTLALSLLLAGPLAALALTLLPAGWRVAAVPWGVSALALLIAVGIRGLRPPEG